MNVKIIDNKTGIIRASEVLEGSDTVSEFENSNPNKDLMLSSACKDVSKKIFTMIPGYNDLGGMIIKVQGKSVYIDIGKNQGVKLGEQFVVYKEGEALIHPVTGEMLGVSEEIVGTIKITDVEPSYSVAEIKKESRPFSKGLLVKRGK